MLLTYEDDEIKDENEIFDDFHWSCLHVCRW